jgi:hypothetical protein
MLLQVDGSRHARLEEHDPGLTLFGLVDEASNKVPAAHFHLGHEVRTAYLRLFRSQAEKHGLPCAICRGQHGACGATIQTDRLRSNRRARSPQAKGQIEPAWRTFQD